MRLPLFVPLAAAAVFSVPSSAVEKFDAAPAINALGLDLYREEIKTAGDRPVLLSPYSIASALAMTYAGATGNTQAEMQRVLRLPADRIVSGAAFRELDRQLTEVAASSAREVARLRDAGGDATPFELTIANRLFAQDGYAFRPEFIDRLHADFGTTLEKLDFRTDPDRGRKVINDWVAHQTKERIRDLLPAGLPTRDTRMVLVNALYLRAAWLKEFSGPTRAEPFHFLDGSVGPVDTMSTLRRFGYAKHRDYSVVTVPYQTGKLQFVLLVPDAKDGVPKIEQLLTAADLAACARLERKEVLLHLPKFKLAPESMSLGQTLQALGMKSAFDQPRGSANFDGMAPRRPDDYLFIGDVIHKTWLSLDEHGTEAAAATAVVMLAALSAAPRDEPPPIEVRADRPFLFAIQHIDSGACLFLGRVTDPRSE